MQIYAATRIHASHCGTDQKDWEGRVTKVKNITAPGNAAHYNPQKIWCGLCIAGGLSQVKGGLA